MGGALCRAVLLLVCVVLFLFVILVNALAATGKGLFQSTTGNVSAHYDTFVTPAAWTFSIWGLIYTWLSLMTIYLCSYLFRRGWCLCLLPVGFFVSWLINMLLNIIWLLLWDREQMLAALVVLVLISLSGYNALMFCCYASDRYGLWLHTHHPKDLLCLQALVENGLALYTTWTSIAALINFSLVLNLWGVTKSMAATASLCLLLAEVVGWFVLENCVLDRWVRNVLTVYPVIILALIGNISKHHDPEDPTPNVVFMVALLLLSCVILVIRVVMVIWRNRKYPLYSLDSSHRPMTAPGNSNKSIFM